MVHVSADSYYRGNSSQPGQHLLIAHVTRVQNVLASRQRLFHLRTEKAVGVGKDAHSCWVIFHSTFYTFCHCRMDRGRFDRFFRILA